MKNYKYDYSFIKEHYMDFMKLLICEFMRWFERGFMRLFVCGFTILLACELMGLMACMWIYVFRKSIIYKLHNQIEKHLKWKMYSGTDGLPNHTCKCIFRCILCFQPLW
jgi:hypothetical protein